MSGITFIDSTPLAVCPNQRIQQHKVFTGLAARGKNSMGWFYGFKLHLTANDRGELLCIQLTSGNVDDRKPVPSLTKDLFGKLIGDKGYISQKLTVQLFEELGVHLITFLRLGEFLSKSCITTMRKRTSPIGAKRPKS